jgi:hypothetical protein
MSHPIEDRLREAYQAKTAQLTEQRLDQLAAAREQGLDGLLGTEHTAELPVIELAAAPARRRGQHRWIAPSLAAAAIAAVALGVTALVASHPDSQPRPNPPATHISTPPPSTSAPAPSASATQTHTQTVTAPPYLPAGQTGSRSQVPWSIVGSGWRLLQPLDNVGTSDGRLYLYDPAGGRYLITNRLPGTGRLLSWSPDGRRAMLQSGDGGALRYRELDLHTGEISAGFSVPLSNFITYTRPKGLAVLIQRYAANQYQLVRYGTDGTLEHLYAAPPGLGSSTSAVLYLPDGSQFVGSITNGPLVLFGNEGQLVRSYPKPDGYDRCTPVKWWRTGTVLEICNHMGSVGQLNALYLQPIVGGAPSLLTDDAGSHQMGHLDGWRLSNGDVLLVNATGCGNGGYQVLGSDGVVRSLKLPAAITAPGVIVNMDGDWATFLQTTDFGCDPRQGSRRLIDYNMVTGQTRALIDGEGVLVSWPGDPS